MSNSIRSCTEQDKDRYLEIPDLKVRQLAGRTPELKDDLCVDYSSLSAGVSSPKYFIFPAIVRPLEVESASLSGSLGKNFSQYQEKLEKFPLPRLTSAVIDQESSEYVSAQIEWNKDEIAYLQTLWYADGSGEDPESKKWIAQIGDEYFFSKQIPIRKINIAIEKLQGFSGFDGASIHKRAAILVRSLIELREAIQINPPSPRFFVSGDLQRALGKSSNLSWEDFSKSYRELPKTISSEELSEQTTGMHNEAWRPIDGQYFVEELALFRMFLSDADNKRLRIVSGPDHQQRFVIAIDRDADFVRLNKFLNILASISEAHPSKSRVDKLLMNTMALQQITERETFFAKARESIINGGGFGVGNRMGEGALELLGLGFAARWFYQNYFKNNGGPKDPPASGAQGTAPVAAKAPAPTSEPSPSAEAPAKASYDGYALAEAALATAGLAVLTGALICSPFDGPAGDVAAGLATLERGRRFYQLAVLAW